MSLMKREKKNKKPSKFSEAEYHMLQRYIQIFADSNEEE